MSGLSDGISPAKEEPTIEETYESEEEIFYDASEESRDYKSEWRKIMVCSMSFVDFFKIR